MLQITYDKNGMQDGLGAQIQRIYAIYAIGKKFSLKTPELLVKNVLLHPLDGINDKDSYVNFLKKTNKFLNDLFGNDYAAENPIYVPLLTNKKFIRLILKYHWRAKTFTIVTANVMPIIERFPSIISTQKKLAEFNLGTIVLHLRASGNKTGFILKGEKSTRNIGKQRYEAVIQKVLKETKNPETYRIVVVTDAVQKKTMFSVPFGQESMWSQAGYDVENGKITFYPDPELELLLKNLEVIYGAEIKRGGDPLECFLELMSAEVLVISRSSLSYSAALMGNHTAVYYPSDFWHSPLNKWKPY